MEEKTAHTVAIKLDSIALDEAIEKASRLTALLREVQEIIGSLNGKFSPK